MGMQTVTFIPPTLCGCTLAVTGDFNQNDIINGQSYRQPAPGTITNISIITTCTNHSPSQLMALGFDSSDPFNAKTHIDANGKKLGDRKRGYLGSIQTVTVGSLGYNQKNDVQMQESITAGYVIGVNPSLDAYLSNPSRIAYEGFIRRNPITPDENLYDFLSGFNGGILKPNTCGCYLYHYSHNASSVISKPIYIDHPVHSRKCLCHFNDTNGVNAVAGNVGFSTVLEQANAIPNLPQKIIGSHSWNFSKGKVWAFTFADGTPLDSATNANVKAIITTLKAAMPSLENITVSQ